MKHHPLKREQEKESGLKEIRGGACSKIKKGAWRSLLNEIPKSV
jgi:hypothetical protein